MATGNNTRLTPQDVLQMAQRHTTVANDITAQERTLANNISSLTTINSGAMMTRLVQVHEDWDRFTADIVNQLHTMAETLTSVGQQLQVEDEQNASSINTGR